MDIEEKQEFRRQGQAIRRLEAELLKLLKERDREANAVAMDGLRELVVELYAQAAAYTNLVIVAGYAGAFAVWQFVDKFISVKARMWSALLLVISLALFVGYEIQNMVVSSWKMRHITQALLRLPESRRFEAFQALLLQGQLRNAMAWFFFVVPTVATGLAAGILLICAFSARVLGYQFMP